MREGNFFHLSLVHLTKGDHRISAFAEATAVAGSKGHEKGCDQRARCPLAPLPRHREPVPWRTTRLCYDLVCVFRGQTWLTLFPRQLCRQIDRRNHTVGASDAFARDVEGGAMIGAGSGKGQAESNVYAGMEGMQFQRDQTLIVVHANCGVPFLVSEMEEERVRRDGAGKTRS